MTQEQPDQEQPDQQQPEGKQPADERDQLHFWSFIDYAIARCTRELPGVDPLAMHAVLALHRAASMIVYDLESTVHRPRGRSWPGFRVLFAVWLCGPLESKKVAELTGMSRAAVSALVTTLERDGLLAKERAPHDGRAIHLQVTEEGQREITESFTAHNAREQDWAGSLSEDEQATLITLLEKLTSHSVHFDARHRS